MYVACSLGRIYLCYLPINIEKIKCTITPKLLIWESKYLLHKLWRELRLCQFDQTSSHMFTSWRNKLFLNISTKSLRTVHFFLATQKITYFIGIYLSLILDLMGPVMRFGQFNLQNSSFFLHLLNPSMLLLFIYTIDKWLRCLNLDSGFGRE